MHKQLLAQVFGHIDNPFSVISGNAALSGSANGSGLIVIVQSLVRFAIVIAGLYTFLNFILAGYGFLSAGGDPKAIQKAWEKIWQSIVGLLVIASSFILAVVIGYLIFGPDNATLLISPRIFTP